MTASPDFSATSRQLLNSSNRLGVMYAQLLAAVIAAGAAQAFVQPSTYSWSNVKIGGGGGFVPGIIFNQKEKGLAFAR